MTEYSQVEFASHLAGVAASNQAPILRFSPVYSRIERNSSSSLLASNNDVCHYFIISGGRGLFRRDGAMANRFCKYYSDRAERELGCNGFFTTDELPRYGISSELGDRLIEAPGAGYTRAVAVICVYNRHVTIEIRNLLFSDFKELAGSAEGCPVVRSDGAGPIAANRSTIEELA